MSADFDSDQFSVTMDTEEDLLREPHDSDGGMEVVSNTNATGIDIVVNEENNNEEESADDEDDDDGLEMPERKNKNPAAVWTLAKRVPGGAKCRICEKILKCSRSNTSNILGHLTSKHRDREEVKKLVKDQEAKKEVVKLKRLQKERKEKMNTSQSKITSFSVKRGVMDPLKKKKLDAALVQMTICMNRPFDDVENHFFRNVLHIAEPNYIVPSRRSHCLDFDKAALSVEEALKKDIIKDVTEAGHKTINITSDHGTSSDRFRTKKNALTVARCDKDFCIKKDILKMIECEGSQTGERIREDVKKWLVQSAGWQDNWTVNWVTDNEAKQVNARMPGKHAQVGLPTNYTGSCVDHTAELAIDDALQLCPPVKKAVQKVRSFVNHIKDSSLEKEKFHKVLKDAGVKSLTIIQGTDNRWFYKYSEAERALILKEHIDSYFDNYEGTALEAFDDEDWKLILVYENSLRTLVQAGRVLEGELYPTASSVIPFLDTVFEELTTMSAKLDGASKRFVDQLLANLKSNKRFLPNGYKTVAPYNVLTLLDLRYSDLYFSEEEYKQAVRDLELSCVFDHDAVHGQEENVDACDGRSQPVALEPGPGGQGRNQPDTSFKRRRDLLLAAKNVTQQAVPSILTLKEKISRELTKYLALRGTLDTGENPCHWWRNNHQLFPLLAKFWRANCPFPATSTSSERAFSIDGLIITPKRFVLIKIFTILLIFFFSRSSLTTARTGNMTICRDFWMSRTATDSFRLCEKCPQPPNPSACYKISCSKHK